MSTSHTGRVGVIGGGTMGSGIAAAFLGMGAEVVLIDSDVVTVAAAAMRITDAVRATAPQANPAITASTELSDVHGCDLVVEAVPEEAGLKTKVLVAAEAELDPLAILASNTSSLSIDGLAASLERPERFAGMHFFNPVSRSALVELIRGEQTDPAVMATLQALVIELGKESIEVGDSPGFATSRLGLAIGLEAIRMLEGGVASATDIDQAMVLGYRFPMGPLRLTDLVGLDVRLGIARHLHATLGARFEPPQLLIDKVEAGDLGRKSGRGFFEW